MSLAPKNVKLTRDEYLHGELKSDTKHEYDNGYVVAMVGASRSHNLIALSVASEIRQKLKGRDCRTYMSDMKLRITTAKGELFYYPDVMVSCDPEPPSEYYEEQPIVVIEVLSPSTETRDKLEKLSAYSSVATIKEYVTIAQEKMEVNRYSMESGSAFLTEYRDGDTLELTSLGITLSVREIYAEVS